MWGEPQCGPRAVPIALGLMFATSRDTMSHRRTVPWTSGVPLCMHRPSARRQLHLPEPQLSRAVSLPTAERSVADARRFSRTLLTEWGLETLVDDVALLLSELVTNAVVHVPDTAGDIELVLTRAHGHLVAQVTDTGGHLPRCGRVGPDSENGRGMWLVEQIATLWGHHPSAKGKTVWFTLALPSAAR
ncbi:hypothetical protein CTZ27_23310 [Streptomyces griseocarneus]|nr:hypothetical protein CTZ27_23310 [Streptomyces griseocarneus]